MNANANLSLDEKIDHSKDPIWGTLLVTKAHREALSGISTVNSPRCGGPYSIHDSIASRMRDLSDREKARLTSWLIEQRRLGNNLPEITMEEIERTKQTNDMPVADRADAILRYIESRISRMGQEIFYASRDPIKKSCQEILMPKQINHYELIAFSKSIDYDELTFLLEYLEKRGWIKIIPHTNDSSVDMSAPPDLLTVGPNGGPAYVETYINACLLTFEGYARLAEIQETKDSSRGFMAMWFDKSMNNAWENGFEPGIKEAGYEPMRIDKKEHSNKIDDEIIAEIRRARFVVADLTHGDQGIRGGVYYEAGFARGLGITVIFTCREDCSRNTHFDIRQYNCIRWKDDDLEKLQKDLKNRITAIIGDGPHSSAN